MNRLGGAFAVLLALAASPADSAEPDGQLWTTVIANGELAGDLAASVELQTRFGDDASRLRQSNLRVGLGYRASEVLTLYGGYALVTSHRGSRPDLTEHRLWQQASYALVASGAVHVAGRTRLEQRFFEASNDVGWRLRQQVRLAFPLTSERGPSLVATGELFIALNDADWGARNGLDQVRSFAGVNLPIGPRQTVEIGYLNQYVRRVDADDQINHVGLLTLAHRF